MKQVEFMNVGELSPLEMEVYIKMAWDLYQDPKTKFYPVIDSYFELERIFKTAWMENQLWILTYNDAHAFLPLLVDPEDRYVQANGGLACQDYFELFADACHLRLKENYPNYDFIAGYPSTHTDAQRYYKNHSDYHIQDNLIQTQLILSEARLLKSSPNFQKLEKSQEMEFIKRHQRDYEEVYWDAESMLEELDKWLIIRNDTGPIETYVCTILYSKEKHLHAEIFFLESDSNTYQELLEHLASTLRSLGVHDILFLIDTNHKETLAQAIACGFKVKDDYISYTCKL